jgi:hypothetical protein
MTTTTTTAVAAPMAMIFSTNDDLVLRALDGLTHEELWQALHERLPKSKQPRGLTPTKRG